MNEVQEQITEIKAPAKKKAKKRKVAKQTKPTAVITGEFAGITANDCCSACTADHCVISTVAICKHPYKSPVNGCGPITLRNRARAHKLIKHQLVELRD